MTKKEYKGYQPFITEPPKNEINISEYEDILEYDSKSNNVINTGEQRNIQVEIDSYKDQTLIYNILDKYIGIKTPEDFKNIPELNKKQGEYMDISKFPNNIHDLNKMSIQIKNKIKELEQQEKESNNVQPVNSETKTLSKNETNLQGTEEPKKANQ